MKMVEDAPEDLLSELFLREFFPAHALGLPIEGTRKTVKTFDQKAVVNFHSQNYLPENIVVACAGNVEHKEIVDLAEKFFNSPQSAISNQQSASPAKPLFAAPISLKNKSNLEQAHLIIAAPWIAANDERRYAGSLLNSILGDGNSSRLWQNVREKRGLAYSVGASVSTFEDCGIFSIYAGTSPEKLPEVVDLSIHEIRQIKQKGVSDEELNLAKEQTVSAILLGLESTSVRADALANSEIIFGRQISVEETLEKIENVDAEQVREIANDFFHTDKMALVALGNVNNLKIDRERLNVS
jgi:predicted Zn-dependent peptidase